MTAAGDGQLEAVNVKSLLKIKVSRIFPLISAPSPRRYRPAAGQSCVSGGRRRSSEGPGRSRGPRGTYTAPVSGSGCISHNPLQTLATEVYLMCGKQSQTLLSFKLGVMSATFYVKNNH